MQRRTVLITGATDGIGLVMARCYQAQGARLILIGRRAPAQLDDAIFTPATYCRADLAQPYAAEIVEQFLQGQQISRLDLLIHNAALGYYGATGEQSPRSIHEMVAVNLRAPIALTHALLPYLPRSSNTREGSRGKIVFISSIAAALPCPNYAVYGATKAALDGFARSLRIELGGSIAVQVIAPGPTRTGIHEKSGAATQGVRWQNFPTADRVTRRIVRVIDSRRKMVTIGGGNRLLQLAGRHVPALIDGLLRRRYQ